MAARHSTSPTSSNSTARRVVLVGAVILAVVVVAGLLVSALQRSGIGPFCGDTVTVKVAAEPDIAGHVESLAADAGGCHEFEVSRVSAAEMSARIADRGEMPDIWVPDSAIRLAKVSRDVQIPFETVLNSVASTPVVIAHKDVEVDLSTWTAALATPGLKMGDPVSSGVADAPIMAATSEVEMMRSTTEAVNQSMAALAQGQAGSTEAPPSAREMLDAVMANGGAAIVTEQQAVLAQKDNADSGVIVSAPDTGAVFLSYPMAVTTQDPTRRDEVSGAAEALRDATASEEFASDLAANGFRAANRAPLDDDAGVGEAPALVVRDPGRLNSTLQRWRVLSMPARSLVLVDTSGSMNFAMAGSDAPRIQALVQTATAGLGQFPDDAALGLWAFGGLAGTGGAPYAEVAAVERLDATTAQGTHRDTLAQALGTLPSMVGGETDLYRTVLDAYEASLTGYQPNMINSIIVISDGANDATSSLGRDDFLAQLQEMVDPAKPVIVVTVGLLDTADPEVLGEIANVTGGSSHIARTPEEIVQVFAEAVGRRGVA